MDLATVRGKEPGGEASRIPAQEVEAATFDRQALLDCPEAVSRLDERQNGTKTSGRTHASC